MFIYKNWIHTVEIIAELRTYISMFLKHLLELNAYISYINAANCLSLLTETTQSLSDGS